MQFINNAVRTCYTRRLLGHGEAFMKAIDKNLFKKYMPADEAGLANSAGSAPDDEQRPLGNCVKSRPRKA